MKHAGEQSTFSLGQKPARRWLGRRWLLPGGLALALMLMLGIGAALTGISGAGQAQAARSSVSQRPTWAPMTPGQCGGQVTVTAVRNRTITVTGSNGNTITVHTTATTYYTQYGHAASVNAIRVGSTIYVAGSCTNQGRVITATSIDIVS
jgi:hypothetical protein